jgi:hypothetical protein
LKKFIAVLLMAAIFCSGCALAAGVLAGGIASEVINRTIGGVKNKESIDSSKYQDLLREKDIPDIK